MPLSGVSGKKICKAAHKKGGAGQDSLTGMSMKKSFVLLAYK